MGDLIITPVHMILSSGEYTDCACVGVVLGFFEHFFKLHFDNTPVTSSWDELSSSEGVLRRKHEMAKSIGGMIIATTQLQNQKSHHHIITLIGMLKVVCYLSSKNSFHSARVVNKPRQPVSKMC